MKKIKFSIGKLSLREKRFFMLASIIVGLSIFYLIAFKAIFLKWKALSGEIVQKEAKLIKSRGVIAAKEELEEEYNNFKDRIKVKSSPEKDMVTGLLKDIESIARNSAINILNIKPLPVRREKFYEKYSIQMEIEGDIDGIGLFLYNMDNSFRGFLNIERLEMESKGEERILKAHLLINSILTSPPRSQKVKVKS
jgi:Tfp pilus assembly protein PilO